MGNKIGRRREVVDEKYTRPQGLYHHKDVDHKKLRKLILDSKLAPCYPGDDECAVDLEECPICFLYYPSLNRSRCCMKGICTECFLQMKPPNSSRPTQCPFCKTSNYAVEYRGVKTKEEKGMEQLEEQRVIEAQIRIRQQELHDDEDRTQKGQEMTSSSRIVALGEAEYRDIPSNPYSVPSFRRSKQGNESVSSQALYSLPASRRSSHLRQNREDNCDLDLEEIMVMEAIWLSIQGQGTLRNPTCGGSGLPGPSSSEYHYDSQQLAPAEASPSAGLAFTVAALAEHQHMSRDPANMAGTSTPAFNMVQQSGSILSGGERVVGSYHPESWIEMSPDSGRAVQREEGDWAADYGSEVAEAGTSYTSSDTAMDARAAAALLPEGASVAAGHLLPDSFEEQMMLAMTVSLAEARARTGGQGVTWL